MTAPASIRRATAALSWLRVTRPWLYLLLGYALGVLGSTAGYVLAERMG